MLATIYSKPNCSYCVRAKQLLINKGIEYQEISAIEHREDLIRRVTETTGSAPRTVPQIWLDETYIGGFTELDAYFKSSV